MVDLDKLQVGTELVWSAQGRPVKVRVSRVKHLFVMSRQREPGGEGITTRRLHRVTIDLVPRKSEGDGPRGR